jgi:hypothetical protein
VTEIDSTNSGGLQVPKPMDFSMKNYMSLMDQQNLLIKLVRPDIQVNYYIPGVTRFVQDIPVEAVISWLQ